MSAWPSSSLPRRPRPGRGLERGSSTLGGGRQGLSWRAGWRVRWDGGLLKKSLFAVGNIEHAQVAQGLTAVVPENLGNILGHSQI